MNKDMRKKGSEIIGRIVIMEIAENENQLFDEVMRIVNQFSAIHKFDVSSKPIVSVSGIEIHTECRKVYRSGEEIPLTAKEYDLLYLLAEHKGIVLTYDQIYQRIWKDYSHAVENNTIGYHICKMKKKVCPVPSESKFTIRCVRGIGYCLDVLAE